MNVCSRACGHIIDAQVRKSEIRLSCLIILAHLLSFSLFFLLFLSFCHDDRVTTKRMSEWVSERMLRLCVCVYVHTQRMLNYSAHLCVFARVGIHQWNIGLKAEYIPSPEDNETVALWNVLFIFQKCLNFLLIFLQFYTIYKHFIASRRNDTKCTHIEKRYGK